MCGARAVTFSCRGDVVFYVNTSRYRDVRPGGEFMSKKLWTFYQGHARGHSELCGDQLKGN